MNKLAGHLFYLAGPIDDCKTTEEFISWRKDISKFLWGLGAGVLDPTNKPLLNTIDENEDFRNRVKQLKSQQRYDELSTIVQNIVTCDLHLLDLSSAVILYVDTDIHMCGSWSEATYSCLEKKPLIVFAKNKKQSVPNWLYGMAKHDLFFDNIDEVKDYLLKIHNGQPAPLTERWKFLDMDKIFGVNNEHQRP